LLDDRLRLLLATRDRPGARHDCSQGQVQAAEGPRGDQARHRGEEGGPHVGGYSEAHAEPRTATGRDGLLDTTQRCDRERDRGDEEEQVDQAGGIRRVLEIVGAGGGFKQVLVDGGTGTAIAKIAVAAHLSALLLGWIVAVLIRLATGSATVATVTAAGIIAPLTAGLPPTQLALVVLAVGAGSLFFSHVNDAGFWLVKEYFGLTVGQTIKTWSLMETIISVMGLALTLLLSTVV